MQEGEAGGVGLPLRPGPGVVGPVYVGGGATGGMPGSPPRERSFVLPPPWLATGAGDPSSPWPGVPDPDTFTPGVVPPPFGSPPCDPPAEPHPAIPKSSTEAAMATDAIPPPNLTPRPARMHPPHARPISRHVRAWLYYVKRIASSSGETTYRSRRTRYMVVLDTTQLPSLRPWRWCTGSRRARALGF